MAETGTGDLRLIAEIGQQYVGICDQFLAEQLGRPYTVPELVQFAETAVGTLLASAYVNFREVMGKESAEAWLKKTLSQGAAVVRNMGSDAMLRFEVHVKEMPNKLHKQRQEMQTQAATAPPPEPPKCICEVKADGSCPACVEVLASMHKTNFVFMKQRGETARKVQDLCPACILSQTDRALSSVVPEALQAGISEDRNDILIAMRGIALQFGVKDTPATEKALKETVKA